MWFMKNRSYQILKTFSRSEQQQTNIDNEGERKDNKTGSQNVPYKFHVQVFFRWKDKWQYDFKITYWRETRQTFL